ncbi:MAG: molybdopterin-dependent oxidoreductase [Luminiphilus sp.]|nr:molybdopterin-dependent oxidoreductase [Luminiphilus sp.]
MSDASIVTHHRVCHLCEAMCGLVIKTEGETVVDIRGDRNDPLSRGHVCPKAAALKDIHEDPDRLRKPLKRVRSAVGKYQHVEIEWPEALDLAADALASTIQQFGVDAVGAYFGNPSVHNYGMLTHQRNLFRHIRTRNRFSATSVDQLPHHLVSMWCFGHMLLQPVPDVDNTDYFLMLGANPLASNGSMWTVPDVRRRLKALTSRGGKLLVIDPRRTETAELASEHLFIQPGSDAAFLLAVLHVLFRDDLIKPGPLAAFTDGLSEMGESVTALTPSWASALTGIPSGDIERVAHEFAEAEAGICYGRMGVSTQAYGALCQWAILVINVATGNLDKLGGSLFTLPAMDQVANTNPGGFARFTSRARGLPEFNRELPAATMVEEIRTPGEGQIRLMFTGAGNPVLSTPNGASLDEALEEIDFMISVDPALNETTRHADVILPPSSPLEHDHYDIGFHNLAIRNTARYNPPVFDKTEGAMHDWEIFTELGNRVASKLNLKPLPSQPPHALVDMALRAGPYGDATEWQLSIEKLSEHPSGIDLGPLEPSCPERLQTPDKRIHLAIPELLADIDRFVTEMSDRVDSYRLIGRRHVRDNNSWMHNHQRLMKGRPRCQLLMHPDDVAKEGWSAGMTVSVASRVGQVDAELAPSDEMMPGVVSLPHGYGHGRSGTRSGIANRHAGVSCNDITDDQLVDALSGNAAVNGVPVRLSAAGG